MSTNGVDEDYGLQVGR